MNKIKIMMAMVLGMVFSTATVAQKPEQLKNSYNYVRALEIVNYQGDSDEALGYLKKEIEEHPKNGYAYWLMGGIYIKKEQPGNAIDPLCKAISYLKKDKEWLAFAYALRAKVNLELGNEEEALSDWALATKANPEDVDVYSDRAEYYYLKNMFAESDADFEKICQLQKGNTLGYMGRGRNALKTEKYKEAENWFSYCIKLDPSFSQAYAFRAESKIESGRVNESIDDLIAALDLDGNTKAYYLMSAIDEPEVNTLITKLKVQQTKHPNDGLWSYCIGNAYEGQTNYVKAIEAYKESMAIESNDVCCFRMANCYSELGEYEQALESINQAIEMDPSDNDYVMSKANYLYEMGRGAEAIETYDKYIKAEPDYWFGYYRRAFIKDNLNDTDGAIEDYSTAIVLSPDYAYSYLGRADKFLLKGNKEAAIKDYQMVVALDTLVGESNCAQFAFLGLGDIDKAKAFEDSILAKSASAGNYYDAACLYARIGDKDAALHYLRNCLEKGFTRFAHIRNDDDLDGIRDMQGFKNLMNEFETRFQEEQKAKRTKEGLTGELKEHTSEIPFTLENGCCNVKCTINELPMRFVFDTGASEVSISMVEATFMMKNGYLDKNDVVGSAHYSDALGNISEGTVINLRKVKFGDLELDNVRASVVRNQKAPLLLGQTVLSRAGKIEIDNQKRVIKVKYLK